MLASQLVKKYRYENCAVVALNDGGAMVGTQIAIQLHCVLTLLQVENINLPRESQAVAGINEDGSVSYNPYFSQDELDDLIGEYHQYIEQEKLFKLHAMHRALGQGDLISHNLLKGRNVILVSDGLENGFPIDIANQYLKPISIDKLIVATPMASVAAVDRMHIFADEIYCLSVVEDFISIDHYYDAQDVPDHQTVVKAIEQIILKWA